MKAKQIFHLAVRLVGLVFLFLALKELPAIVDTSDFRMTVIALITSSFWLACACWLLLGGPLPEVFTCRNLTDLAFHEVWLDEHPPKQVQKPGTRS